MSEEKEHQKSLPPIENRRNSVPELETRSVAYLSTRVSAERLAALTEFLRTASADEIAAVRQLYGDDPAVLKAIGIDELENRSRSEFRFGARREER